MALASQQRTAAAQKSGKFKDEIAPMTVTMEVTDKATGAKSQKQVTVDRDECNRPDTTLEGLQKLPGAFKEGGSVTAGNSSQFSDGASAVRDHVRRARQGARHQAARLLPRLSCSPAASPTRWASARSSPCRSCSSATGLKIKDIDIVELNEAFASQVVYCRDKLGIDPEQLNPNGGAISIGHPYGMTGSRMTGTLLLELRRQKKRCGIVTMCIGGGMGAAGLFEAAL